jgi:hypothetical protein
MCTKARDVSDHLSQKHIKTIYEARSRHLQVSPWLTGLAQLIWTCRPLSRIVYTDVFASIVDVWVFDWTLNEIVWPFDWPKKMWKYSTLFESLYLFSVGCRRYFLFNILFTERQWWYFPRASSSGNVINRRISLVANSKCRYRHLLLI